MQNDPILGLLSGLIGVPEEEILSALNKSCAPTPVSIRMPRHPSEWDSQRTKPQPKERALSSNQEMANKINELYNELNQKDKDLREARESVRRLQDSLRDFRKRAEDAEMKAAATLASYNSLSAEYNRLLNKYHATIAELKAAKNESVYKCSNPLFTVASFDPAVPNADEYREQVVNPKEVDAIDIPLATAESIIRKIQGL